MRKVFTFVHVWVVKYCASENVTQELYKLYQGMCNLNISVFGRG